MRKTLMITSLAAAFVMGSGLVAPTIASAGTTHVAAHKHAGKHKGHHGHKHLHKSLHRHVGK
jgi:hypothetical protein